MCRCICNDLVRFVFLCISTFQLNLETTGQAEKRRERVYFGGSNMDNPVLVSCCYGDANRQSLHSSKGTKTFDSTRSGESTPTREEVKSHDISVIRETLQKRKISTRSASIIMASWRSGTQKQYNMYIQKWFCYCGKREISGFQVSLSEVLDFLADLFEKGLKYSAINSARSALSAIGLIIDGFVVGAPPLVIRFLKGVYNLRAPSSKYCDTWDVFMILKYLKQLSPVSELNLKLLT